MDSSFVERGGKGQIGYPCRSISSRKGKQLYCIAASTAEEFAMGIGWLWHFTHAGETGTFRSNNEDRAAALYARWRALHRLVASPARRLRDARLERKSARELDALTDDVLRDVGLKRDVDGRVVAAPLERNRRRVTATEASLSTVDRRPTDDAGTTADPWTRGRARLRTALFAVVVGRPTRGRAAAGRVRAACRLKASRTPSVAHPDLSECSRDEPTPPGTARRCVREGRQVERMGSW